MTNPPAVLAEFPLLRSLPPELRIKIWEGSFNPRVIELHHDTKYPRETQLVHFKSYNSNPAALSACSESRLLAQSHYSVVLSLDTGTDNSDGVRPLYLNPTTDMLAILSEASPRSLEVLLDTIQQLDPLHRRPSRIGLGAQCWRMFRVCTTSTAQKLFGHLDKLELLLHPHTLPPPGFRDGECVLNAVKSLSAWPYLCTFWGPGLDIGKGEDGLRFWYINFISGLY
ncbi:Uu.00g087410.m01.CDS01 [Anthostomella pinea]|uniref:Uu.00g087410.m01.CDS01 n=1 Tax=Anthostomella pinea TaxID=933095 RepID=A0AAI8VNH2_9PEZI|nr:Uu.00g087410.m01.CDS01 [Anthostomella pinea]